MGMSVGYVLILIIVGCTTLLVAIPQSQKQIGRYSAGYTTKYREKRSALTFGAKVIAAILNKARHLYSNGYDNVFVKSGGIKQAEKDFYSVISPDEAKTINKKARRGKVGGVIVTLRYEPKTLTFTRVKGTWSKYHDPSIEDIVVYKR